VLVLAAFVAIALVAAAVGGYAWVAGRIRDFDAKNRAVSDQIGDILTPRKEPGAPFYMVLIGEDKRPGERRSHSDTLMVVYVDPPEKRATVLSIPRDTRVAIPGHGTNKINTAALLGGPSLTIQTVKQLTGLPISHYVSVDFQGFKDLVDAVGGITVDVPQRIEDSKAADHNWRAKVVEQGPQKLDGAHALTFVRSRQFVDGDLTRIKDQQIFLKALGEQTMRVGNVVNAPKIVDAVTRNVTTDMSADEIVGLAADFRGMGAGSVESTTIPGTPKYIGGVSYVIPDTVKLAELVRKVESGESIAALPATSTAAPNAVAPSSVTVAVRNGSGRSGRGASLSTLLKKSGFQVPETGNAARSDVRITQVVYRSDRAKAMLVRNQLGQGEVVPSAGAYQFDTDVLVVVGRDWNK
jgi:LCP family protein required for cell wall assembly